MKKLLLRVMSTAVLLSVCPAINAQNSVSAKILDRLDKIQSELSDIHKFIFSEDFSSTGIRVIAASDRIMDYSESAPDKAMYEKELNHYLSQLGVGYISLPDAGEYESEDVDLMGIFSVNCLYPAIAIGDYANATTSDITPFKPTKEAEMQSDNINLFDLLAAFETIVPSVEGEKYEWFYAKEGFNHRFTVEDKGSGYTISLSGINRLKEYSAEPGNGTSVTQANTGMSAAEKLQQQTAQNRSLPDTYTIWIKTSQKWYVAIRKEQSAVFLSLDIKANGDMNFQVGTGWYIKQQGGDFIRYPYLNGKWDTAQSKKLSATEAGQAIGQGEQEYILIPGENMNKERVKLFEKAAYFDDLDIKLP